VPAAQDLNQRVWYRFVQLARVIAYLLLAVVAIGGSLGQAPYTTYQYRTGIPTDYPGTPFNWGLCFGICFFGWLVIEVSRAGLIYLFSGKNILSGDILDSKPASVPAEPEVEDAKEKSESLAIPESRTSQIEGVTEGKLGMKLDSWAYVNDAWREDLETYRNIELAEDAINLIYVETWFYGVFLTAKKAKKYLTGDELEYFTLKLGVSIGNIQALIDGWTDQKKRSAAEGFEPLLLQRWHPYMDGDTLATYYQHLLSYSAVAQLASIFHGGLLGCVTAAGWCGSGELG
jgi:hypothetical protein